MLDRFYFFKGRVALYAILKAMEFGRGDEVILPGFTCVVVPNAIAYLEAKPVYIDIDPCTFNIDTSRIEGKITKRTKAIIAQHTFGIPADMDTIIGIAKKYSLYVIEDSCHAIGSKYKGREVGTFGDAAFFSSQWSKPVTTGLGGWAVVNNDKLRAKMENLFSEYAIPSYGEMVLLKLQYLMYARFFRPSLFWFAQSTYRLLSKVGLTVGSSSNAELEYKMPDGYQKRMSQWHRDLLENKMLQLKQVNSHRKLISSLYKDFLKKKGISSLNLLDEHETVFLRYPLLVRNKSKVLAEAKKRRIEIGDWFVSPIHPNLNGWEKVGYRKGMCHTAEEICEHIINLPTHQGINEGMAERIVSFLIKNNIVMIMDKD